ncbi:ATP-dependent helicase HrpB [Colwellia echini]|uniref:ATP-dependent helicase HrpB n=1 Tax=Colwellia echini TaxID=1982103 RepID=A0ABY3N1J0_9GAMM|nr:ATP-dependent helicase HrpB [Colwellia echini]TYK67350.1 ATP-dependent helicase HrpB [Colwellia echini]
MSVATVLPIEAIKQQFCQTLDAQNMLILSAPPGAGKSTCLPLWLLTLPSLANKKIYLLQPRRLAVKNIATFLAKQLNEKVGETVGYRLRNDSKTSLNTRLEVITEGILTQIIQKDAELENTALIVFDEFHERSLQGDLAFALAREVQTELREDLKILLMSATLDIDYLAQALPDAHFLKSDGRSFPVEINYQAPKTNQRWRDHALLVIKEKMLNHQGSILVFTPGIADIRFLLSRLTDYQYEYQNENPNEYQAELQTELHITHVQICPLYGELSLKEQQQAIAPCAPGQRKIVLATNIAETSLTIDGIDLVIDCGLEKVAVFDSASLMNKLVQKQISKASAVQRAGRAGRLMPGHCLRLYGKDDFERRPLHSVNDIQQADLLPTLIEAARWGVSRLADLPLLELPSNIKEQQAWQELQSLAIVNDKYALTMHGQKASQLPCHPRFAHMILMAQQLSDNTALLACLIAALLEERDIFKAEQSRYDCDLNHRLQMFVQQKHYKNAVHERILQQAVRLAQAIKLRFSVQSLNLEKTGILLAYAYPERIAKSRGNHGEYICANGKGALINEQDALASEDYIVIVQTSQAAFKGSSNLTVRLACYINFDDITRFFSTNIKQQDTASFDAKVGRLVAKRQTLLGAIVLAEQSLTKDVSASDISAMWCSLVQQKGLDFLPWQAKDLALKTRWQWLNKYCPEFGLVILSDEFLLANLFTWLAPFVGDIKSKTQMAKLDISAMLLSLLNYQQQKILNKAAPSVYIGPTGRHCPITYSQEQSPKVSLPMQELYGLTQTPMVGIIDGINDGINESISNNELNGKGKSNQGVALLLELLSPAQRPIQVTQDLVKFWSGSYQAVQKDMKSRYPRHYWPDDPINAKPTNKTKRHIKEQI